MNSKLFFFSLVLTSFISIEQTTAIPDVNFEQTLIDFGLDDILNGTAQNDSKI